MRANRLSRQSNQTETTMRYLLGTLSEEEKDRFEEMYFSDDAVFEEVEIAEGELIDRYVRGELAKSDHARFEAVLAASPRLGERVQFARVWKDNLAASHAQPIASVADTYKAPQAGRSWWSRIFGSSAESRVPGLALAFGVLLVLVGGAALFAGWLRLREESRRLEAQQTALEQRQRELDQQAANLKSQAEQLAKGIPASPTPIESPQPKPSEEPPSPVRATFAMTLSAGGTRGGGSDNTYSVPAGTKNVQVTLNVTDPDYSRYQATISTVDRKAVFTSAWQRISHNVVTFSVPANRLPPGDYTISLNGRTSAGIIEPLTDYTLHIRK